MFEDNFTYNPAMSPESTPVHPADNWEQDAQHYHQFPKLQLRLAAMAGHIRLDKVAARRAALVDILSDGRPHTREVIWETIASQLGQDCWGKLPHEALARDLAALRIGGIRIGYSRRVGATGYYLQYPPLQRPVPPQFGAINWDLINQIRQLSIPEKNNQAFAAAHFALKQKQLILSEEHQDWSPAAVEREARRLVFGISSKELP